MSEITHGMDVGIDIPEGTVIPDDFELGDGVRRDSRCVEKWEDCASGEYNPYCCRFPKSCSATSVRNRVYRKWILEPAPEELDRLLPPMAQSAVCMLMFVDGVAYVAPAGSRAADEDQWLRVDTLNEAANLLRTAGPSADASSPLP